MSEKIRLEANGNSDSLFPARIEKLPILPPVVILRQQAQHLSELTNKVLEGVVYTNEGNAHTVVHSFYIKAPLLDGYRYRLLSVSHRTAKPYPAQIWFDATTNYDADNPDANSWAVTFQNSNLKDEESLRNRLKEIFSSEATRQIIASLVAQSEMPVVA